MPALLESMDCNDVHELNELAKCFKEMVAQGDLSTYKAVILAADCHVSLPLSELRKIWMTT